MEHAVSSFRKRGVAVGVAWLLSSAVAFAQPEAESVEPSAPPEAPTVEPGVSGEPGVPDSPGPADAEAGQPNAPAGSPSVETLSEAVSLRNQVNAESAEAQEQVDDLSDETDKLHTRYRAALRQIESLRTYNHQMEKLVESQKAEMSSLEQQLDQIELVSRDVTPLMLRMIDALWEFVALDLPFLEEERAERIAKLQAMMNRADVTESEKYRRIMEAYQIENEYGRTIEAYRSTLEQGDRNLTVDFLRVGRIALVYQTLDGSQAGVWNQAARSWEPLDRSYRTAIRQGLRIARKQAAPDLIGLPLPPPREAEGEV